MLLSVGKMILDRDMLLSLTELDRDDSDAIESK